jgi:hypothetical protein
MTLRWLFAAGLLVAAATATSATAAPPRPLPHFTVVPLEGEPVASESLIREGTWVVIQVEPDCASCDALLARMDDDEHAALAPRIAVIVTTDVARARAMARRFPRLREARWVADPISASRAALGLPATPTVSGLRGGTIEWRFAGLSRRPGETESILSSWLKRR